MRRPATCKQRSRRRCPPDPGTFPGSRNDRLTRNGAALTCLNGLRRHRWSRSCVLPSSGAGHRHQGAPPRRRLPPRPGSPAASNAGHHPGPPAWRRVGKLAVLYRRVTEVVAEAARRRSCPVVVSGDCTTAVLEHSPRSLPARYRTYYPERSKPHLPPDLLPRTMAAAPATDLNAVTAILERCRSSVRPYGMAYADLLRESLTRADCVNGFARTSSRRSRRLSLRSGECTQSRRASLR